MSKTSEMLKYMYPELCNKEYNLTLRKEGLNISLNVKL